MKIPNQNRNDSNNSGKIHEHLTHPIPSSYKKSEALEVIWYGNQIAQVRQPKVWHKLVVYSGSILLIYSSLIFFISKIPASGGFAITITCFIAFFSIILIIIGVLLWIGVFPL